MKKKGGIVLETRESAVIIVTETGEFVKVRCGKTAPKCGEEYEGYIEYNNIKARRILVMAAAFFIMITLGFIDYHNPVKAMEIDMKSPIILKVNRWNRVVSVLAYDNMGKEVTSKAKVKNMELNNAIQKLIDEGKKEKLIKTSAEVKVNPININARVPQLKNENNDTSEDKKENNKVNETQNKQQKSNNTNNSIPDKGKVNNSGNNTNKNNQEENNNDNKVQKKNNDSNYKSYKKKSLDKGQENTPENSKVKSNGKNK